VVSLKGGFQGKQKITVTVDPDVWLYFKMKDINLSGHINTLLKYEMNIKNENVDILQLEKELDVLKEEQAANTEKAVRIQSLLMQHRVDDENNMKKAMEQAEFVSSTIRNSGRAKDLFG